MKNSIVLIMMLFVLSCKTSKQINKSKDIELIKQLTYCKCLEYNIKMYVGEDSVDMSRESIADMMSVYGGSFVRSWSPLLDSLAYKVYADGEKARFDTNRYPSSYGLVEYKLDCLKLYKSKQLDSLARVIYTQTKKD